MLRGVATRVSRPLVGHSVAAARHSAAVAGPFAQRSTVGVGARRWAGGQGNCDGCKNNKAKKKSVPRVLMDLAFVVVTLLCGTYVVVWLPLRYLLQCVGIVASVKRPLTPEELEVVTDDFKKLRSEIAVMSSQIGKLHGKFVPSKSDEPEAEAAKA